MYDFQIFILILIIFIILLFVLLYNYYYIEKFTTEPPKYDPTNLNNYSDRPSVPEPEAIYMDYILANTQLLIPSTNEINNSSNIIPFNHTLGVASQISLLRKLKEHNDKIREITKKYQDLLQSIQNKLFEIKEDIEKKQDEKNKLSEEVSNLNMSRYLNKSNINLILNAMESNIDKERSLKKYEEEIINKKNELQKFLDLSNKTSSTVLIKDEQLKPLIEKLSEIEKKIVEINNKTPDNICTSYSTMPHPQKDAFIYDYNTVNNPSYSWCVCNDTNKKSEECTTYMDCNKNYQKNKDKNVLIGEDLTLYMKCLSRYPNFPKYLTNNINTKS
jgi:hypothetical protein